METGFQGSLAQRPMRFTLLLEAILMALVAACGGGGTGPSENPVTQLSQDDTESTLAVDAGTWMPLANENATFTVPGIQTVRYGSGATWIQRAVTSSGQCSNYFFGTDPLPYVAKKCEVFVPAPAPVGSWSQVAVEGGNFTVSRSGRVRYGFNATWIEKTLSGTAACTNTFFGSDPLRGTVKVCQLFSSDPLPVPILTPAPASSWSQVAIEGQNFSLTGSHRIRYGRNLSWTERTLSGDARCTNAFFGLDPLRGTLKVCEVLTTPPPTPASVRLAIETGSHPTNPSIFLTNDSLSVSFGDDLNPACATRAGDFSSPDFAGYACHKRAVRANVGIKKGEFRYFEGRRLGDKANFGFGYTTANSAIDPYCCLVDALPLSARTPPSMSVNTVGGVFVQLHNVGGFNPDSTFYYGFAVDYTANNPVVYVVTTNDAGALALDRQETQGFNGVDVMPFMYGHTGLGNAPVGSINFGAQQFHYDMAALRAELALMGANLSQFKPGVGVHTQP